MTNLKTSISLKPRTRERVERAIEIARATYGIDLTLSGVAEAAIEDYLDDFEWSLPAQNEPVEAALLRRVHALDARLANADQLSDNALQAVLREALSVQAHAEAAFVGKLGSSRANADYPAFHRVNKAALAAYNRAADALNVPSDQAPVLVTKDGSGAGVFVHVHRAAPGFVRVWTNLLAADAASSNLRLASTAVMPTPGGFLEVQLMYNGPLNDDVAFGSVEHLCHPLKVLWADRAPR